ncbi:MAG: stage II sporulation protein M [Anaerolineaceae bacterium]|nr:stage II sporulation protein M [Anaerolineaceae bacterium]
MTTADEFIKLREADWKRLEALVNSRKGRKRLTTAEVHELGTLYRAITSDLALSRRDFPNQRVTLFLNQLLTRTHGYIYQQESNDFKAFIYTFTHRIPTLFRQKIGYFLVALALFLIPAIIGYRLADINPAVAEPLGLSAQRQILANHETWTDIPANERPAASTFIMTNNIRVALLCFAGGIAFGLFSVYVLVTNGLIIGAVLGLAAHYGMGSSLLGFVVGHGVIELSVIFMAGGAGLQLGWALLNPGLYSRRDALSQAARRAVLIAVAAVPLLIIAGIIEGLFSPTDAPFILHVAVGLISGGCMYAYLLLAGRSKTKNSGDIVNESATFMLSDTP